MFKILQYQKEILEKGKAKSVVLIHGEEEYLVKAFIDKLRSIYGQSFSLRWGDELEPEEIFSLVSEGSIFGGSENAVVVLDFEEFLKKVGRKKKSLEALINTLRKIRSSKLFLVVGRKLSSQELSKEPFKTIASIGDVVFADKLHPKRIAEIVKRKFEKEGGGIEEEAARLLIEMCGGDLMALKQESEKLITYANGEKVTAEDVKKVCVPSESYTPFDFIDYLFEGDLNKALRSLKDTFSKGVPPLQILGLLYNYAIKLYTAFELKRKGESIDKALEAVGVKHQFAKMKFKRYMEKIDEEKLRALIDRLYRLDLRVKTYFSDPQRELMSFVIGFTLP